MKHFDFGPMKIEVDLIFDLPDLGGPPGALGGVRRSKLGKVRLDY